ncbi:MAG: S8 family serine peptidase [Gammaproteobacteria bacterium]|nr:S8 family serine peptidase [Gammaproteobacteria bacterium]
MARVNQLAKKRGQLKILVARFDQQELSDKAKVTAVNRAGKTIRLKFDKRSKHYISPRLPAGVYQVTVQEAGLRKETRAVVLQDGSRQASFHLGKKDMPAYYAGAVRIPFKPLHQVGIVFHKGAKDEDVAGVLTFMSRKLRWKKVKLSDFFAKEERFYLFDYGDDSDDEVAKGLTAIQDAEVVAHAGAVIYVRERSMRLVSKRIVVKFGNQVTQDRVDGLVKEFNLATAARPSYAGNSYVFTTEDPGTYRVLQVQETLARLDDVVYAELDCFVNLTEDLDPDDPYYLSTTTPASNGNFQWHLPQIRADDAWDTTTGDTAVIVAVCDSGFDPAHADFAGKVYLSANLEPDSLGVVDAYTAYTLDTSHGMAVTGVASAQGDNATGIAGVAMDCQVMGINRPAYSLESEIANMLVWVSGFSPQTVLGTAIVYPTPPSPGADVIQNAYGLDGADLSGIMNDALDFITTYGRGGKGCVVIFSTGNSATDFVTDVTDKRAWATYEKTIAVGACTRSETWATYSNYGSAIDLVAPGGDTSSSNRITSTTQPGSGYFTTSTENLDYGDNYLRPAGTTAPIVGTSFSSPQVSGTAALMLSVNPDLTWIQIRDILRTTARQIDTGNTDPDYQYDADGHSDRYGHGILDCAAAVDMANDMVSGDAQDVYARDHETDGGTVAFGGPVFYYSPDLWVRNLHPEDDDPTDYTNHQNPLREQSNYLWGRIENRGDADSGQFYVRFYITHFPGAEFLWPDDFIPDTTPSAVTSLAAVPRGTYLIGEYAHEGLSDTESDEIWIEWPAELIPPKEVDEGGTMVSWHPCLLMEITPHDSAYHGTIPYHTWDSNDIVQRNISIEDADGDGDALATAVFAGHPANHASFVFLEFDGSSLPAGVRLYTRYVSEKSRRLSEKLLKNPEKLEEAACQTYTVHFQSDARIRLAGDDDCQVSANMPKGASLEFRCCRGRVPELNARLTNLDGKPAVALAPRQNALVPVWVSGGLSEAVMLEIRIRPGTPAGTYSIPVIQRQPDMTTSGGYQVELRVK